MEYFILGWRILLGPLPQSQKRPAVSPAVFPSPAEITVSGSPSALTPAATSPTINERNRLLRRSEIHDRMLGFSRCRRRRFFVSAAKMPSHKTFRIKKKLAKKMRQNRPIPYWIRMRTDNTIRYNAKRRHWRRTKLGF
uniref:60S ribosomal protein L39 n=2 Tax=Setaria italica TaxID=4555 RepID=K3YWL0_SETIT